MHEVSLAQDLIAIIIETAQKHSVDSVATATLELGALTCVEPDAMQFAFEVVRQNTVAKDCQLLIQHTPLLVSCPECGFAGPSDIELLGCPSCGKVPVEVTSGREMRLVSIDVED